ncbi:hypothetical protein EYR40_000552 [Pleurotus pulmonarius]|nr:hypothetical protein EYR40_000552 [Pleurotus pulmonarius]
MLAVATAGALLIAEPHSLKRGAVVPLIELSISPNSCAWANGSTVYLSSDEAVHRYDRVAGSLDHVMSLAEPNSRVLVKDGSGLVVSDGRKVHIMDVKGKTTQTLESHNSVISSISLSNDVSLLASATSSAVHVHNLATGSNSVLRGLALAGQSIGTCVFHPHSRTRLLLGIGRQFVVYDTTRPSGPAKTIPLDTSSSGDINAISSSPFSKSLVAVSTMEGYLGLIDLEKEKGLFRTLNLGVAIPSMSFSQDGASVYLGTCDGRLLVVDLRALEKPPKEIMVNPDGKPIAAIAIQSKSQVQEALKKDKVASTSKATSSSRSAAVPYKATPKSPSKPSSSKKSKSLPTPDVDTKSRNHPEEANGLNDSQISVQLETLSAFKAPTKSKVSTSKPDSPKVSKAKTPTSLASPGRATASARPAKISSPNKLSKDGPRKPRTMPTNTRARVPSENIPSSSSKLSVPSDHDSRPRSRQSVISSASRAVSTTSTKGLSTGSRVSSMASARSASSLSSRTTSSATSSNQTRKVSQTSTLATSRTPSPELPGTTTDPATPIPAARKRAALGVLGLGTPEVNRWIEAGNGGGEVEARKDKGKGKAVGFQETVDAFEDEDEDDKENERSLVISPLRRGKPSQHEWAAASPARFAMPPSPGVPTNGPAHELLRTIVKDVMCDFQQESRNEMVGLHLDMLRMGRSWRKDMKEMMEYMGSLKALQEENLRLREENERLRRGY